MSFHNEEDVTLIDQQMDSIIDQVEAIKLTKLNPTIDDINMLNDITLQFVKEKKRKVYGGLSQNKAIEVKNKEDTFYPEDNIADIDIYSPDPINDMIELANRYHQQKFQHIQATEAGHKETYAIFVFFRKSIDLSYVPRHAYNNIPTFESEGIVYVHPDFSMIDMYKIFTDPWFSNFRWEKTIRRVSLLQKHYPIKKATKTLRPIHRAVKDNNIVSVKSTPNDILKIKKEINDIILTFLTTTETSFLYGDYLYNHYIKECNIKKSKIFEPIDIPFMEIISTEYQKDTIDLIKSIVKKYKIDIQEHYPFWTFQNCSTYIMYKKYPVAHICHYNNRCVTSRKIKYDKKEIHVLSYNYNLMMTMIKKFISKTRNNNELTNYNNIAISHLRELKNIYFKNNPKKNILDETLFKQFIIDCHGVVVDPLVENRLRKRKKYLAGKIVTFNYRPDTGGLKKSDSKYQFANTSGNYIRNVMNLKITPRVYDIISGSEKKLVDKLKDKKLTLRGYLDKTITENDNRENVNRNFFSVKQQEYDFDDYVDLGPSDIRTDMISESSNGRWV